MHAGLVTGKRRFELVEMPEPEARPGLAVVTVHLCGICGTDVHGFLSDTPYNPAICGHEWVGSVEQVGAGVDRVATGDRVVAAIAGPCGHCPTCRAGRPRYCTTAFLGMVGRDALAPAHGGFAPRIGIDASRLVRVADGLSNEQAAIVEPATVALHAVRRSEPTMASTCVVQGCGPIGLLTIQAARAAGAGRIIAVEPTATRRRLALDVGADEAIEPSEAMARFARAGVDLVFECAGVPATVQSAVDFVRPGGVVNIVGLASGHAVVNPHAWLMREVTVVASLGYLQHEFATTMALIDAGKIRTEPLHDRTVGLSELPETIAELADNPSSAVKVLVDPTR